MIEIVTPQTYDRELRIALELAREAGAVILNLYEGPLDIQQKADADDREPVTQADTLANEIIVARLDRKSTRLNSSHIQKSRMPSSA